MNEDSNYQKQIKLNFKFFVESLQLLGSQYDLQIKWFPPMAIHNIPDELALTYNQWLTTLNKETLQDLNLMNESQYSIVIEIDSLLDKMSGLSNVELWTLEALKENERWNEVRKRANILLNSLNIKIENFEPDLLKIKNGF